MAFIPELIDRKTYNEDGVGGMHVYSPWWLDSKKLDFPRGYHIEVWGGTCNNPKYKGIDNLPDSESLATTLIRVKECWLEMNDLG